VIIFIQPVDDSRDAVFNRRHLEIDRQAKPLIGEPEIGQKLFLVDREEHLDGSDFHNDLLFDHQLGPKSGIDADILIDHWNRLPAHRAETPPAQLIPQDRLTSRFQQARAKRRMNAESRVDDLLGNGVTTA